MSETREKMSPVTKVVIAIAIKLVVLTALAVAVLRWKGLI
jgi:hypothetical protein